MARTRMVTRTINVTEVEAICLEVTTVETTIKTFELTGSITNKEQALKQLKKLHETDTFKVVAIQELKEREEMYGMREIDFINVAHKLDPATRKMVEEETEETEKEETEA